MASHCDKQACKNLCKQAKQTIQILYHSVLDNYMWTRGWSAKLSAYAGTLTNKSQVTNELLEVDFPK